MDRQTLLICTAALLTTLHDLGGSAPEGPTYAALMAHGATLDDYHAITAALLRAGLIAITGNVLSLTAEGRDKADQFAALA